MESYFWIAALWCRFFLKILKKWEHCIYFYTVLDCGKVFHLKLSFVRRVSKLPSGFPEPNLRDFCKVLQSPKIQFDILNNNNDEKIMVTFNHQKRLSFFSPLFCFPDLNLQHQLSSKPFVTEFFSHNWSLISKKLGNWFLN